MSKEEYLNPQSKYYGKLTPQTLAFNANLQEFSTKVGYIVALETGGNLETAEAYKRIKALFKQLKQSKKAILDS